jgi:hypothetical protein
LIPLADAPAFGHIKSNPRLSDWQEDHMTIESANQLHEFCRQTPSTYCEKLISLSRIDGGSVPALPAGQVRSEGVVQPPPPKAIDPD